MENLIYEGENQKRIERFLMAIYSLYCVTIIILSNRQQWGSFVDLLLTIMLTGSWIVSFSQQKKYNFRAKFVAFMIQCSVVLYAINMETIKDALPVFFLFVVLMGLYGIAEIVLFTLISGAAIFLCHVFWLKSIPVETFSDMMNLAAQIANVLLLEYVVYIWTKRNKEGSLRLIKVIEEIQAVETRKDDFVANVSHEIRTPINTICGMSEIVLEEKLPEKIRENLLDIQRAGRNLKAVVSDILDFSELQSGNIELEEEAYNITSTINDVINMTMARNNEKKVELIVDCDANIPSILLGDEKKLRRVIMNLVDNAIKFTNEGCVAIAIGYRKESYGINLNVSIKDTGIGIDEVSLEKLFTSFNQVDSSSKRQESGIGLGLAISQALVQKMGGAITVKSKPGKGTTVKFSVPQKVVEETPIVSIHDKQNINAAIYIDMEQFSVTAIRDEYSNTIKHMVEWFDGKSHICRNFAELKRREEIEKFTHIFISILEYTANTQYFDELAEETNVIVVLDHYHAKYVTNPKLLKIYKPFYILSIASVLNGLDSERDEARHSSSEKFTIRNAHVLVVDDNRMNIKVIEGVLATYNIKVTTATSGQEALEKIMSANYDFVFMDHMMPEMDGVETLQRIRQKVGSYFQKVPIVALTANAVAGTREMLIGEGFNDFLEKPIERSVLERVLKRNISSEKIIYQNKAMYKVAKDEGKTMENAEQMKMQGEAVVAEGGWEAWLAAEGVDVEKGILYCNGKEIYLKVLQGYCEESNESLIMAEELFKKQDWTNYTIVVHGIKGAMRSIGADKISELAKDLEFAGKEYRIDYIMEHHEQLMQEYKNLFEKLRKNPAICPQEEENPGTEPVIEQKKELPVIEEVDFEEKLLQMETAMYTLDGETLKKVVSQLQGYQYKGTPLDEALMPAKRKVEMSDYMSAVEMVRGLKERLSDKEK
ncbi:MAG: response regulator [Lachnospiraceae bacterium]|nr:response regulator [Lachnospiraceae bacterium]